MCEVEVLDEDGVEVGNQATCWQLDTVSQQAPFAGRFDGFDERFNDGSTSTCFESGYQNVRCEVFARALEGW
eukprot:3934774-Rhodomonas_salina.2